MSRLLFVLALALVLLSPAARAEVLEGLVVSVADGDTITVLDDTKVQHRIRLSGIDAPEKRQPFGTVSKQHLADAVLQRRVVCGIQQDRPLRAAARQGAAGRARRMPRPDHRRAGVALQAL